MDMEVKPDWKRLQDVYQGQRFAEICELIDNLHLESHISEWDKDYLHRAVSEYGYKTS